MGNRHNHHVLNISNSSKGEITSWLESAGASEVEPVLPDVPGTLPDFVLRSATLARVNWPKLQDKI